MQLPDGSLFHQPKFIQPVGEFLTKPAPELIRLHKGSLLCDLLTNDLGIVNFSNNKLELDYIKPFGRRDVRQESMRLLGKLAEALIVRECREDPDKNRFWASLARRGNQVKILDEYVAIGTGFQNIKNHPNSKLRGKYNPNDTQRDIIWVKRDDEASELMTSSSSGVRYSAGLQIKVSRNKDNVLKSIRNKDYFVPVVYFDLNGGFSYVARKLQEDAERIGANHWQVGVDLIQGRDVSEELHYNLLQFLPVLDQLFNGDIELSNLLTEIPEIRTAITNRLIQSTRLPTQQPVKVWTLPT
ncbi:hypothetical protein [Coleofasciculus sp. FACHB-712]|uniref:hypothetical protein n=1 Tax=Coleofasciculus sp. FACHB-712 TaxID=2692789 RepID=UPI001685607B|nr:hypothetical protein [Coleofasciculus sp. FACHB-712]